jgi:hypothetical protein
MNLYDFVRENDIVAGEGADRFVGFPQCEVFDFNDVAGIVQQHVGAAESFERGRLRQHDFLEMVGVSPGTFGRRRRPPSSDDHRKSLYRNMTDVKARGGEVRHCDVSGFGP